LNFLLGNNENLKPRGSFNQSRIRRLGGTWKGKRTISGLSFNLMCRNITDNGIYYFLGSIGVSIFAKEKLSEGPVRRGKKWELQSLSFRT